MSVRLTLDIPESAFSLFRVDPARFVREMRIAAAVKWYEMGKLSQAKAAELCEMSREEFLDTLHRFQVSPFQMGLRQEGGEEACDTFPLGTAMSFDFWHSPSIEELATAQEVGPLDSVGSLFGTWPGEAGDGFEEAIKELRQEGVVEGRRP
jgi:predicted HTH domain antitoxin